MERIKIMEFNNTRRGNFLGHDGFIWWVGVIENRMDPLNLGRCQVRIKGLHSENNTQIESQSLPWSQILYPVNTTNSTPTTLKEGDMVIGFFMDGDAAQYPVIFGAFHGIPEDPANPNTGFNDPRTAEQLKTAPKKPQSIIYKTDGTGAVINEPSSANSYPDRLDEPTTSRLSRNEDIDQTIVHRKRNSTVIVPKADKTTWKEPVTPYNTRYPYNQVTSTESGHYFELDDTPGAERTHLYHRSGTFFENHPDGSRVDKIVKDKYTIVMRDDNVFIMGNCAVTVQGNAQVYVQKDCTLKVDKNLTFNVEKNWEINVKGNITSTVGGNIKTNVSGTIDQTSTEKTTIIGSEVEIKNG
jgi:hypothetical protein